MFAGEVWGQTVGLGEDLAIRTTVWKAACGLVVQAELGAGGDLRLVGLTDGWDVGHREPRRVG